MGAERGIAWRLADSLALRRFVGCNSRPGTGSLHPIAIENGSRGNEAVGAFDGKDRLGRWKALPRPARRARS
jgi:hypothetical protein